MRFKRIIALLLGTAMSVSLLTGCDTTVEDVIQEYTGTEITGTEDTEIVRDYDAGRKAYDADEVVLTIEGEDMTWEEFYGWICYSLSTYEYSYGEVTDFAATGAAGTLSDDIINEAVYIATLYKGIEKKAAELGITNSPDIDTLFREDMAGALEFYGTEEDLETAIVEYYGSEEIYEYMFKMNDLSDRLFEELYGVDGEKLTEEQLAEGSEGYLMAKHILVSTVDDEGNALDEDGLAAAKEKIENVYDLLCEYEGDDLNGYFDDLTAEYTDDPGHLSYPDGYLFQDGDMVTEFYDATLSVEEGQFSEIVESSFGYHIVLRLPIDPKAVPMSYASYGYNYSLGNIIANNLLTMDTQTWTEEVEYSTTAFYDTIDLSQVF